MGAGSGAFATSNTHVEYPDNADWNFGTGDFTIDCWFRLNNLPTTSAAIFAQVVDQSTSADASYVYIDSNYKLNLRATVSGSDVVFYRTTSALPSLATNTWYHLAIVRSGTSCLIFLGGVSLSVDIVSGHSFGTMPDIAATFGIGKGSYLTTRDLDGNIDEFRVSKGIARWTTTFTPPSAAYFGALALPTLSIGTNGVGNPLQFQQNSSTGTATITNNGNIALTISSLGALSTNAQVSGVATLNGGTPATVTVSTTAVTTSSSIFLTYKTKSANTLGTLEVTSVSAGTSFQITALASVADASTVSWLVLN